MINNRKIANLQEKRITRNLNQLGAEARQRLASGSLWFSKSDVISKHLQIEAKTKSKPSKTFSLKKEWFDKIENEALLEGKIPVVVISFGDGIDYFCIKDTEFFRIFQSYIKGGEASD